MAKGISLHCLKRHDIFSRKRSTSPNLTALLACAGTVLGFGIDPKMVPGLTQVVEQALRQQAEQAALQQSFANTNGAAGAASAAAGSAGPVPQILNTPFVDQQRLLAHSRISVRGPRPRAFVRMDVVSLGS